MLSIRLYNYKKFFLVLSVLINAIASINKSLNCKEKQKHSILN